MPKYIVQHTHIKHGRKGDKESELYAPGDEIDLTEKEAAALGDNVKQVESEGDTPPTPSQEGSKKGRK